MSNLGAYQWMTTTAKKVGGPVNLLAVVGVASIALYKGGELVIKKFAKTIKASRHNGSTSNTKTNIYEVTSSVKTSDGLVFAPDDQYRVLDADGDAVLIEKIGDSNNPYFASAETLRKISNYPE